jgi:hypothetical protein
MDGIIPPFLRVDGRGEIRGQLQFGVEIQLDLDNDLLPYMLSFTPEPGYSTVTDTRTPLVLYRDHGAITIDRFKELIGALTFEEITTAADDIVRVIVQAQRQNSLLSTHAPSSGKSRLSAMRLVGMMRRRVPSRTLPEVCAQMP